ncbi:L,D-transpeptidase [Actinomadura scrupuli]|uniref:L,D-transpeptidase n=1 Tax=Actinomadura scrupuli TaxID=559629 RepID=UPI003D967237
MQGRSQRAEPDDLPPSRPRSMVSSTRAWQPGASERGPRRLIVGGATALMALITTVFAVTGDRPPTPAPPIPSRTATPAPPIPTSPAISPKKLARLPKATTYTVVSRTPLDTDPFAAPSGEVVHPTAQRVVYASPGGRPIARLPSTQLGAPTWVPVIASVPGWQRILLPSRPNRATGWISTGEGRLQTRHSDYLVRIEAAAHRATVLRGGHRVARWKVAVGTAETPTPLGRTFILTTLTPAHPTYSRLFFPLGAHSDVLKTFDGGPGTIALHTWPSSEVFGHAVTHGCVRVPARALRLLARIPPGSPVIVTR